MASHGQGGIFQAKLAGDYVEGTRGEGQSTNINPWYETHRGQFSSLT